MKKNKREQELAEEIAFHIAQETEQNIAQGLPPDKARRKALLEFGAVEAIKQECRAQHWTTMLDSLLMDLRDCSG